MAMLSDVLTGADIEASDINDRYAENYSWASDVVGNGHALDLVGPMSFATAGGFAAGTLAEPGWHWNGDSDTGFYHNAADQMQAVCGGVAVTKFSKDPAAGLVTIPGANITGVDAIAALVLDRTFDVVGDSLDLVIGGGGGMAGNRAGRLSWIASGGAQQSLDFHLQSPSTLDGYSNRVVRMIGDGCMVYRVPGSAGFDSHMNNGSAYLWIDEAANQAVFRVKYSTGTLKSATLALA